MSQPRSFILACLFAAIRCVDSNAEPPVAKENIAASNPQGTVDLRKVEAEIEPSYSNQHPEIQESIHWTARTFAASGMWIPEDAYPDLTDESRETTARRGLPARRRELTRDGRCRCVLRYGQPLLE